MNIEQMTKVPLLAVDAFCQSLEACAGKSFLMPLPVVTPPGLGTLPTLLAMEGVFSYLYKASVMHLKPYWNLQKKTPPLESSKEALRISMSHQEAVHDEKCKASYMKSSVFPSTSPGKASSRRPFGVLSPNVLCSMSGKGPVESSLNVKAKKNAPSATIHQGEEGEGPLDIWAVVKPGNTKEKIAFFAAHQCSNRIGSMKIKSSWDIDGRATKRRKKSGDRKEAKIQFERMREVNSRCYEPEPFACGIEHCSVHCVSDSGDGVCAGRPLSVIQMVAFLEQRASAALLAGCAKSCTNPPAVVRVSAQSRGVLPASEPFSAPGACEEPLERGNPEVSEPQSEPVRVLDMVARLESECLKRQSPREPGSLSRNNSFRRNVGRVLLANGAQAEGEGKTNKGTLEAPGSQENPVGSVSVDCGPSSADHCSLKGKPAWEGAPRCCPARPACASFPGDSAALAPDAHAAAKSSAGYDVEMAEELEPPFLPRICPQATELPTDAADGTSRELVPQSPAPRRKEPVCISITVSVVEKDQPSSLQSCEDPLPGRLFFLPPGQQQLGCCELSESTTEESSEASQLDGAVEGGSASEESSVSAEALVPTPASPAESASPVLEASSWKKQVSHDFLETRFKIQQLLEPQQYMAFLPHHIMVKIFRLLPTKSLVALKCTCCYFKFIIEYYNIRPADSRWVRDPRYREDPCKQCKKKYVKGDVSLCRWHPKPYCQALPYGPGYWMCCHRSQKGFPGCKLGLHDNHWVPACHSFNRVTHKKAKGTETEEDY